DANTIASGAARFRLGTSPPVLVLQAWAHGQFELLISDLLVDEVVRTLSKPYFLTHVEPAVHAATVSALKDEATCVAITTTVSGAATHPEDDVVLATAVSAMADYLVTGDRQLQRLGHFRGIAIVSPRDFLTLLVESTTTQQENDQFEKDSRHDEEGQTGEDKPDA
ncbi:MAG TPA: PIN domain-containing protein, partial [Thermomicrobiales bacterium]|nr:PIN domain-containing protein [Thermomicrobiales bacterium]